MKKLLFILLLCGCATTRPPEVALELPQPEPQQYKQRSTIPQPPGFLTDKYIESEHHRMLESVKEFMEAARVLETHLSLGLDGVPNYMVAIVESIKPGIDLVSLIKRQRLLIEYMNVINEYLKIESQVSDKLYLLNNKTNSMITSP